MLAPLLLHLRRQPPQRVVQFSSLQFLEQTPLVVTTRRRMERWLLLLLRCLALVLLALMFARPYQADEAISVKGQGRAVVLLLDRSASMGREGLWDEAVARLNDHLAASQPSDRVAVGLFDQSLVRRVAFSDLDARSGAGRVALVKAALAGAGAAGRNTQGRILRSLTNCVV